MDRNLFERIEERDTLQSIRQFGLFDKNNLLDYATILSNKLQNLFDKFSTILDDDNGILNIGKLYRLMIPQLSHAANSVLYLLKGANDTRTAEVAMQITASFFRFMKNFINCVRLFALS